MYRREGPERSRYTARPASGSTVGMMLGLHMLQVRRQVVRVDQSFLFILISRPCYVKPSEAYSELSHLIIMGR